MSRMLRKRGCKVKATNERHTEVAKAANGKHTEVLNAGKLIFCKRTRALYRLMYPKITNNQLNSDVSDAWDRLSEKEKNIYILEAQGKLGIRNCTVMINPVVAQLMGLSNAVQEECRKISSPENTDEETESDADDDPDYKPYHYALKRQNTTPLCRKRKRSSNVKTNGRALLAASNRDVRDEELTIPKRLRESKSEAEFNDDPELKAELEKFDLMLERESHFADFSYGDEWITPDPKDLPPFDI